MKEKFNQVKTWISSENTKDDKIKRKYIMSTFEFTEYVPEIDFDQVLQDYNELEKKEAIELVLPALEQIKEEILNENTETISSIYDLVSHQPNLNLLMETHNIITTISKLNINKNTQISKIDSLIEGLKNNFELFLSCPTNFLDIFCSID